MIKASRRNFHPQGCEWINVATANPTVISNATETIVKYKVRPMVAQKVASFSMVR